MNIGEQASGRKIRLKNLLDEGLAVENMVNQQSSLKTLEAISNIILTSDNIINEGCVEDRAEHTTEVVMDAQVLKMSHELVSKVLLQSSEFNDRIYQNAMNSVVYRNDDMKWDNITKVACGITRTTHTKSIMLGAIDVEPIERVAKQRQKRKRNTLAEEKRPESIDKMKREDKGAQKINIIHQQIKNIFDQNKRQPIPFYQLVVDPESLMNTVENAFQLAFLARDSIIAIETGEDGYPQVRLCTKVECKAEGETRQSICSLNWKICRVCLSLIGRKNVLKHYLQEMALLYNIKAAMLRVPSEVEDNA